MIAITGGLGLLALLLALVPGPRSLVAGLANTVFGTAIAVLGGAAILGRAGSITLASGLPGIEMQLSPSPLGGIFLVIIGAVGAVAALFGIGYAHGAAGSRTAWASYAAFLAGMALVPLAGDVVTFLLGWELMALASTILLLAEHRERSSVSSAALWYSVMTHLSFLLVLAGFAVLAVRAGTTSLAGIAAAHVASGVPVFVVLLGCATKAGMVPLHVWLPRAHPEAPSHVSAVMSAAMVKLGIYGMALVALQLAPGLGRWWGAGLMLAGALSAVYGILFASVAGDVKRLLAYSTTENVGLAVTALGAYVVLRASQPDIAGVALLACVLLVASHAAFKTTLFLGAGAILHATGERDMDKLGGLAVRMPVTARSFAVGALGAAALPITGGFVAEWVLLQAVIHASGSSHRLVALLFPVATAVVALTLGLALLTFVKCAGITFLARPRSEAAAQAHEANGWMRTGMALAALAVVGLGLVPGYGAQVVTRAVPEAAGALSGWAGLGLPGAMTGIDPVRLLALSLVLLLPVAITIAVQRRRRPRRIVELGWGCGQSTPTARMEYTATSYAEPLARIFARPLHLRRSLSLPTGQPVTEASQQVRFEQHIDDSTNRALFEPVARALLRLGDLGRRLHNGSIHRYLMFSFVAVLVVVVVASL